MTQPLVLFQHGPKDCKACGFSTTLVVREKGKAWVEARDLAVNTGEEMQARLGQRTHACHAIHACEYRFVRINGMVQRPFTLDTTIVIVSRLVDSHILGQAWMGLGCGTCVFG